MWKVCRVLSSDWENGNTGIFSFEFKVAYLHVMKKDMLIKNTAIIDVLLIWLCYDWIINYLH